MTDKIEDPCGVEERFVVLVAHIVRDRVFCSFPGNLFRVDIDQENPRPLPVLQCVVNCSGVKPRSTLLAISVEEI